jgi:HD-like signal output (HDOD) protein
MKHWNMPEEITTVVGEHHNIHYNSKQATYVWLTQLAGQALSAHDLSDSDEKVVSEELCLRLGLSEADVEDALSAVMGENTALDAMADTLCA